MLEQVFASRTRARLMESLLGPVAAELSMRELIRRVGTGASSVQRELERLEQAGLVRSRRLGNARVFSAAPDHPLHAHLRSLVAAAVGPPHAILPPPSKPSLEPSARERREAGPDARIAPFIPALVQACRAHGVTRLALFGVSTDPQPEVEPRLDIVVRFGEDVPNRFDAYFELNEELDLIAGMPVHIVEDGTVRNAQLRDEIERTRMSLYDLEPPA